MRGCGTPRGGQAGSCKSAKDGFPEYSLFLRVGWRADSRPPEPLYRHKKTLTVDGETVTTATHTAKVELATKVTDTASKLRHTLAHELCHLAAWAIDGEMKPPHGHSFKQWCVRLTVKRGSRSVPDNLPHGQQGQADHARAPRHRGHDDTFVRDRVQVPVEVRLGRLRQDVRSRPAERAHYDHEKRCTDSAMPATSFGRHSASIDPDTHGCPCGARLVPIDKAGLPKPGHSIVTATGTIVATPKSERKKSKWVEFLQVRSPPPRDVPWT